MRRYFTILVSFFVALAVSDAMLATTPPPAEEFFIEAISRTKSSARGKKEDLIKVCTDRDIASTTEGNEDFDSVLLLIDVIGPPDVQHKMEEFATDTVDNNNCRYFKGDIAAHASHALTFTMNILNDQSYVISYGEAEFPVIDSYLSSTDVTISQQVNNKKSLRIELTSPLEGWDVCQEDGTTLPITCDETKLVCYGIGIGEISSYSLCIASTSDSESTAILNTATIDSVEEITTTLPESDVTSALLNYETSEMTIISTDQDNFEYVAYKVTENPKSVSYTTTYDIYAVCITATCTLDSYSKNSESMEILQVNKATPSFAVAPFQDFTIRQQALGTTIIEIYWDKIDKDYYMATLATLPPAGDPKEVEIDCKENIRDGGTLCYAYFVGLTAGTKYQVTVAPASDVTWPVNDILTKIENNQIAIEPLIPTTESGIESTSISEITTVQKPNHADYVLEVCFSYSGNNHNNSRYEAILIDEDGHWMKIYKSRPEERTKKCFSPVNLLESPLSVTTANKLNVVIVERELAGNRVISSGRMEADLSALRASAPGVDDGSNGATNTFAIVGAAIAGIACLMALVAAAVIVVMKVKRGNDELQYPLHRRNIEDSSTIHGLENPIPTM